MAKLIAVYKTPKNVEAFNAYYFGTHVPLAKKIPGLRGLQASDGPIGLPVAPGAVHLVAMLEFDSGEAALRALGTPEGQATAGDLANFADGGVDLMIFDTKEV